MKNSLFKNRWHALHERHDFGSAGMRGHGFWSSSVEENLFMPLMPLMPHSFINLYFFGGGYTASPHYGGQNEQIT